MGLALRFSPRAWAEWKHLSQQPTEVGAFGWTRLGDPLYVERLWIPRQTCTMASVEREASELARCIREGLEAGLHPGCTTRVWLHTHPGNSPRPSSMDEAYWREFTEGAHAQHGHVMGIMAKDGSTYARLAIRGEYNIDVEIPAMVDVSLSPEETATMDAILAENIQKPQPVIVSRWPMFPDATGMWPGTTTTTTRQPAVVASSQGQRKLSRKERKRLNELSNRTDLTLAEKTEFWDLLDRETGVD